MLIEVVPYDPNWPRLFQEERDKLLETLGEIHIIPHHIGSTSVVGLAAKPIIDILLEVENVADIDAVPHLFEGLGYEVMGEFGIPGRRYYRKGGERRTHHIHAFQTQDPGLERHLAFRDYLAAHPDIMGEYASLKKEVAIACNNDITTYSAGKNDFVKYHEAQALLWRKQLDKR